MPGDLELPYGMNPHQVPAFVAPLGAEELPFRVLNGRLGYINGSATNFLSGL
jgi:AICAR transformylase/IMP cyclohydrolase PurH